MPKKASQPTAKNTTSPKKPESKVEALAREAKKQIHTPKRPPTAELEAQIAELKDKLLRSAAEIENMRKRSQVEIQKTREYSISEFAKDMVGVVDNLIRACNNIPKEDAELNENIKNVLQGVEITKKDLLSALERHGIKRIDPKGQPFDHNFHQAISQIEDDKHAPGTVIDVVQAGYSIKDRLLRPALVAVSKAKQS